MGLRLDMKTINDVDKQRRKLRPCEKHLSDTDEDMDPELLYYIILVWHWEKLHNKYFGKIPQFRDDCWPEEYTRTDGLKQQLWNKGINLKIAVRKQDFELAAKIRDERTRLAKSLEELIYEAKYARPTFDEKGRPLDKLNN